MGRPIHLSRTEAEGLVKLLEQCDEWWAPDLAKSIRELFGMATKEQEGSKEPRPDGTGE